MSRKAEVLEQLSSRLDDFHDAGVAKIGIFGSVAREEDTEQSDVDILIELAPVASRFRSFTAVCDILDETIGSKYDLVTKEGLSPFFGHEILEETEYVEEPLILSGAHPA